MNMYKFGNYICKLREEKNLTQSELASILDVTDKSVSKWENGQAFPRIDTFEKLATALGTSVEDIFSASKDGVTRICFANDFCDVMHLDVDGQLYVIKFDECKWVEITSSPVILKITGDILTDSTLSELEDVDAKLKDRIMLKFAKKAVNSALSLVLQADCIYKLSDITADSIITVDCDTFDLGDKAMTYQDFVVTYPKLICSDSVRAELLEAKAKNAKKTIKAYKRLGLASDLGLGFLWMLLSYPFRGLYFKHLCSPRVLKKNILNAEAHKAKSEKRNGKKKSGRLLGCLSSVALFAVLLIVSFAVEIVSDIINVESEKPYLVSADYSKIIYYDSVYVRIDELPEYAYETTLLGAQVWVDTRTQGLSKIDQSLQGDKVKLYEDANGREYLWLVEDYVDTILSAKENGDDKDYEDFDEHYVYVCESPQ